MGLRTVHVDAFTDTPFAGNPAAVCVLPAPREAQWMQQVAREMNLLAPAIQPGYLRGLSGVGAGRRGACRGARCTGRPRWTGGDRVAWRTSRLIKRPYARGYPESGLIRVDAGLAEQGGEAFSALSFLSQQVLGLFGTLAFLLGALALPLGVLAFQVSAFFACRDERTVLVCPTQPRIVLAFERPFP